MKKFSLAKLKTSFFRIALTLVMLLILVNTAAIFLQRLNQQLNQEMVSKYQEAKNLKQNIIVNLNGVDMSVRGFLLVKNQAFEDTFIKIRGQQTDEFARLDALLSDIGYAPDGFDNLKRNVEAYYNLQAKVIGLGKSEKMEEAMAIISEDRGTQVWMQFMEFGEPYDSYFDEQLGKIATANSRLIFTNSFLQLALTIIGLPLLLVVMVTSIRNQKTRASLLALLQQKDKELIFDSGENAMQKLEIGQVVNSIVAHLEQSRDFVDQITDGNYQTTWQGMDQKNAAINQQSLSGKLMEMRDKMAQVKLEGDARAWFNQAVSDLGEVIRKHQGQENLYREVLVFVVKKLGASAGSLFVLQEINGNESVLVQKATFAFDREKLMQKQVAIGEGLIGQVFLEAETLVLEDLPKNYLKIQSGLGDALPTALAVAPLKYNEAITGVLEIASLDTFSQQQINFLDKAGESIASSLQNQQNTERTNKLLKETQQLAEQLRSQEEEIRQNLEEMQATSEESERKYRELQQQYSQKEASVDRLEGILANFPLAWMLVDVDEKIAKINLKVHQVLNKRVLPGLQLEAALGYSLASLQQDPGLLHPLQFQLASLPTDEGQSYLLVIY